MFSIGRYDPAAEDAAAAAAAKKRKEGGEASPERGISPRGDEARRKSAASPPSKGATGGTTERSKRRRSGSDLDRGGAVSSGPRRRDDRKVSAADGGDDGDDSPMDTGDVAAVTVSNPFATVDESRRADAAADDSNGDSDDESDDDASDNSKKGGEVSDGDSSSSVPSSSSSDDDDSSGDDDDDGGGKPPKPALRVIAPEQSLPAAAALRNRRAGRGGAAADEGLDDFDIEGDGVAMEEEEEEVDDESGARRKKRSAASRLDPQTLAALRMCEVPLEDAARAWSLPSFLVDNLRADLAESSGGGGGGTAAEEGAKFFPVQALVVPDVLSTERRGALFRSRDVCVSAPTGSGKTLAFVLPVLGALAGRRIRRLRALVVLPSRDLAEQVFNVFKRYSKGSDLRVGLAVGQSDFAAEQKSLILGEEGDAAAMSEVLYPGTARLRLAFDPQNAELAREACSTFERFSETIGGTAPLAPRGGRSGVDVLVATPGRLMDHLDRTPGFTLQHLRFLIIDEADRLLSQGYQSWIGRVLSAAAEGGGGGGAGRGPKPGNTKADGVGELPQHFEPVTWRHGAKAAAAHSVAASVCRPVPLRKLLFSATLTKDPRKLAALGLVNPKTYDARQLTRALENSGGDDGDDNDDAAEADASRAQAYSLPDKLEERTVACRAEQKPLVLLALLLDLLRGDDAAGTIVVFTASVDSTHRLARLLQLLWAKGGYGDASAVAEFSSALNRKQRSKLLRRATEGSGTGKGKVSVIVCSDGMSRGMDLPSVGAVVNYDVPRFAKTYVHRCGRTARAGRGGTAISVLKAGGARDFAKMRGLIDRPGRVEEMGVRKELVRDAVGTYRSCVRALREVIRAEEGGELNKTAPMSSEWTTA